MKVSTPHEIKTKKTINYDIKEEDNFMKQFTKISRKKNNQRNRKSSSINYDAAACFALGLRGSKRIWKPSSRFKMMSACKRNSFSFMSE